ncbi:MAG: energy-coupling factor transporter transmembrane protein EcfT [Lactobacillaceae bacterium]|jgi:energy-coupling factor transport system permease protein|nr:energy-coupling factor transporter transmembrane protein EcfT [Lactobacillaceae bacterium]
MNNNLFGYQPGTSFIHQLTGSTKLIGFLALTLSGMLSFDLRYLVILALLSIGLLWQSGIKWARISFLVKAVAVFAALNIVLIYLFAPQYGTQLFGAKHVILGSGGYALTLEQLVYESIVLIKYLVSLPLALLFLLTTNPSEFAAGMNKIGISYRFGYAFALTLRYIPDIQAEYKIVSNAQQARGFEMSSKAKLSQRLKGVMGIMLPMVFSSLSRIDEISRAMELRRFGRLKHRTWYYQQILTWRDGTAILVIVSVVCLSFVLIFFNHGRYWYPL